MKKLFLRGRYLFAEGRLMILCNFLAADVGAERPMKTAALQTDGKDEK